MTTVSGRNKEIKDFLEFNKNEGITYPNLWDTLRAFIKKLENNANYQHNQDLILRENQ